MAYTVVTSHSTLEPSGKQTGLWLEEFAVPYKLFIDAGFDVTVVSVKGAKTAEREEKGETWFFSERQYGAFSRSFRLPEPADDGKVEPIIGKVSGYKSDANGVTAITVEVGDEEREVPCDAVLAFYGLAPKLGPIAEWGLDINRKTINVDTEKFETSKPGIYAVGDINFYPGKKKLILSGFHEAALAAFAAKERIEPEKKVRLQYTTTSPIMHERLGIEE